MPEKTNTNEPQHDKTNKNDMCAQRRLRSAWESAQSDQSPRCFRRKKLPIERTVTTLIRLRMPRLIWVFAGRTCHFVGFVVRRLKYNIMQMHEVPNNKPRIRKRKSYKLDKANGSVTRLVTCMKRIEDGKTLILKLPWVLLWESF